MDALKQLFSAEQVNELIDVQQLTAKALVFVPKLVTALIVLLLFWLGFRLTRNSLRRLLRRGGLDPALITLIVDRLVKFTLMSIGIIMSADQLGVNVAAALAGLGVAGIAIGFAAQDLLSNVIAGFVIFWDQPFRVGDFVKVAGEYGRVHEITLRSTRIRTNQNSYVVIPNRSIIDNVLVNQSTNGQLRIDVPVGIAYKEDIATARRVLLAAMKDLDAVDESPPPAIAVTGLGDSSVDLEVRVWIGDAAREAPMTVEVVEASKIALDAAGIQIPFPHRQLFLDDVTDRAARQLAGRGN